MAQIIKHSWTKYSLRQLPKEHGDLFSSAVLCAAIVAIICLFSYLPHKHSPDGNGYYLVTLKLLHGEWRGSVEGIFSPLLSWLMLIPAMLGASLPESFKIVQSLAAFSLLIGSKKLCRHFGLSGSLTGLALLLISVHLIYSAFAIVSSDLLAATLFVWFVEALTNRRPRVWLLGLLAAEIYYAKAFQFPIALAVGSYYILFHWKSNVVKTRLPALMAFLLIALVLVIPWVAVLTAHYHEPTFSGQQFILSERLPLEYSPHNKVIKKLSTPSEGVQTSSVKTGYFDTIRDHLAKIFVPRRMVHSLNYLRDQLESTIFGKLGFWGLLFFSVVGGFAFQSRAAFIIVFFHATFYLITWGAYPRYYFPVIPLFDILAVIGFREVLLGISSGPPKAIQKYVCSLLILIQSLIVADTISTALVTYRSDFGETDNEILNYVSSVPELRDYSGSIAGGPVTDPYPSLAAYSIRRPMWLYVGLHINEPLEALKKVLAKENVTQIIWNGGPPPVLDNLKDFSRTGPHEIKHYRFYVYSLKK